VSSYTRIAGDYCLTVSLLLFPMSRSMLVELVSVLSFVSKHIGHVVEHC